MKLLLTAFEPFGGEESNPSLEALRLLPDRLEGWDILKLSLPVAFGLSLSALETALDEHRPDAVLCLGQAGGRVELTPERVAINVDDAGIPDNLGQQPIDRPIRAGGPAAYFSTLPVKAMAAAIRAEGLPASVSNSAGTYVCNHLMYGLLDMLAASHPDTRGGFMHVPFTDEQAARHGAGTPGLPLSDIAAGVTAALRAIILNQKDARLPGGSTH